jgi:hypothetical protein
MNVDMCTHIVSHGSTDDTPFVLINTPTANAWCCPSCAVAWTEQVIQSQPIHSVLKSLVFTACGHDEGLCRTCLSSFRDALTARWSCAMVTDKRLANRLMRIRRLLSKNYDKGNTSEAYKARSAYRNANILGMAGVRGRAGAVWTANRAQRLSVLRPPVHTVVVVPASLG